MVAITLAPGTTAPDGNKTRVLVDGNITTMANLTFRLLDGASEWSNGVVLEITVGNLTLASGDHQLKVIPEFGKPVTFKFKI